MGSENLAGDEAFGPWQDLIAQTLSAFAEMFYNYESRHELYLTPASLNKTWFEYRGGSQLSNIAMAGTQGWHVPLALHQIVLPKTESIHSDRTATLTRTMIAHGGAFADKNRVSLCHPLDCIGNPRLLLAFKLSDVLAIQGIKRCFHSSGHAKFIEDVE